MKGRGSLGIDGDLSRVRAALHWFSEPLSVAEMNVLGKDILELGPGRTSEVLSAFVLAGGRSGLGLDVSLELPEDAVCAESLQAVATMLEAEGEGFLAAVGSSVEFARDKSRRLAAMTDIPLKFQEYNGRSLPLSDHSIDLVLSRSVLEHVHPPFVRPLLAELRRVLRPGGVMVHFIDLRDHMHLDQKSPPAGPSFSGVRGDWLDALTYPDWLFRAMFSRRPVAINRIRAEEWCYLFRDFRFELVYRQDHCLPIPPSASARRLQEPWRSLPADVLRVAQLTVALKRG